MTPKKLSIFIDRFLPSHLVEEYPYLRDFMYGYLQFLERDNGPYDIIAKLLVDENISNSVALYLDSFQQKYTPFMPKVNVADIELIVQQIRAFYNKKGTEDSFRWLFRAYYGQEIDFYYPRNDILRASDGDWYAPIKLVLVDQNGTLIADKTKYVGTTFVGKTSGDRSKVEKIEVGIDATTGTSITYATVIGSYGLLQQGEQIVCLEYPTDQIFIRDAANSIIEVGGKWRNTNGHISSNKMIQDNYYYQDLSYEITVGISPDTFLLLANNAIHPAGRKLFAKVYIKNSAQDTNNVVALSERLLSIYNKYTISALIGLNDVIISAVPTTPSIMYFSNVFNTTPNTIYLNDNTINLNNGNTFLNNTTYVSGVSWSNQTQLFSDNAYVR